MIDVCISFFSFFFINSINNYVRNYKLVCFNCHGSSQRILNVLHYFINI